MGRLARVLSFLYTSEAGDKVGDVKVDPGGGANVTPQHFQSAGEDSRPLPSDLAAMVSIEGTGREVVVGYLDPANLQQAAAGEKIVYSRNPGGVVVATIHLKTDGSIAITSTGDIDINGATIGTDGTITSPVALVAPSIVAGGKELAGHNHNQVNDSGGNVEAPTGPNN